MQDPLFQPTFPACLTTEMPRSNREETCFKLFKLPDSTGLQVGGF